MNSKYIKELAAFIARIDDKKDAEAFLKNILTPKDLDEIAQRLQVFKCLFKGISQREIAKKIGVSIGTVSRGSREMQYGENGIKKILSENEDLQT